jgi:hypothetical protein
MFVVRVDFTYKYLRVSTQSFIRRLLYHVQSIPNLNVPQTVLPEHLYVDSFHICVLGKLRGTF